MKKAIFTLALVAIAAIAFTQRTFVSKTSKGGGFNVESGLSTGRSINIDGTTFSLFETKKGSTYIKCKSPRTGNDYAVWVGKSTAHTHEGRKVYISNSGSYCVYKISSNSGNPYPVWLDME
jgi:hypothetical protein